MRYSSFTFAVAMLIVSNAFADGTAAQKEIQAHLEAIVSTIAIGDPGEVAKASVKDFQFTDIAGHSGTAIQFADRAKALVNLAKNPSATPVVVSVTVSGDKALAFFRAKITGIGTDRLGIDGPMLMNVTYRTEWVSEGSAWKLKSAKEVMFDGNTNKRPLMFSKSAAEEETRKQFQPVYAAVAQIYEKQDWEGGSKAIPEGFVMHDSEGKLLSKAEMMDRVKSGAKVVQNPIVAIEPQQVALDGDKVVVIRVMKLFADVILPGGKSGRLTYTNVARDIFAKGDKAWAPKSSDELYAEASVNGLPIPISAVSGK